MTTDATHAADGRRSRLAFAESAGAASLAAFLARQLRWDRTAAARITAGGEVLAVFTRPARFNVLAVLPGRLRAPVRLDVTVSAGELLEGIDEERGEIAVPGAVTGPSWAGVLPPRGGWQRLADVAHAAAREAAAAVVAEFRQRTEGMAPEARTRQALDGLAEEIWSRPLPGTPLPLRAVHAAHALGFLPPAPPPGAGEAAVLASGPWLRLRTALGSIAVRRPATPGLPGLNVMPVRRTAGGHHREHYHHDTETGTGPGHGPDHEPGQPPRL